MFILYKKLVFKENKDMCIKQLYYMDFIDINGIDDVIECVSEEDFLVFKIIKKWFFKLLEIVDRRKEIKILKLVDIIVLVLIEVILVSNSDCLFCLEFFEFLVDVVVGGVLEDEVDFMVMDVDKDMVIL